MDQPAEACDTITSPADILASIAQQLFQHADFAAARAATVWARQQQPSVAAARAAAHPDDWECEHSCGFRHTQFEVVELHERHCSSIQSASAQSLQRMDRAAAAQFLKARGLCQAGERAAGIRALLRCLRLSAAHPQAQQALAGWGKQELGGLRSQDLLLGFNASGERLGSAAPDAGKLVVVFRAEFEWQGGVCVLLPSRGSVAADYPQLLAVAVGLAGAVVVRNREGQVLGQDMAWESVASAGSWLSVESTRIQRPPKHTSAVCAEWPARRCPDTLVSGWRVVLTSLMACLRRADVSVTLWQLN